MRHVNNGVACLVVVVGEDGDAWPLHRHVLERLPEDLDGGLHQVGVEGAAHRQTLRPPDAEVALVVLDEVQGLCVAKKPDCIILWIIKTRCEENA